MENLEESIRTLKEMFIERKPVIEVSDSIVVSFNLVDMIGDSPRLLGRIPKCYSLMITN